jgi:hypothetical protein
MMNSPAFDRMEVFSPKRAQRCLNRGAKSMLVEPSLLENKKHDLNSMHPNFMSLNPIYDNIRYEKAVKLANLWTGLLSDNLNLRVEDLIRKDFILALSQNLKSDYITY